MPPSPLKRTRKQKVEYDKALLALSRRKTEIEKDMAALIDSCTTFEDVVELWPGAEEIRHKVCKTTTALSTLSQETVARIRKLTAMAK